MYKSDFQKIIKKVEEAKRSGSFDLSTDEDLSIAVMNLISLEEHFFFTAEKTGKDEYLKMLQEVREMRKDLLAQIIKTHEGETWCISKHLLAGTMRLVEVGTKLQTAKKQKEAQAMFANAYKLYSLFWALRLKLLELKDVGKTVSNEPWDYQDLVSKLVDCCKE